jgi:hypothetical protein
MAVGVERVILCWFLSLLLLLNMGVFFSLLGTYS